MKRQTVLGLLATFAMTLFASFSAAPAFATSYTHNGVTCTQNTGSGLSPNVYTCVPSGGQFKGGISGSTPFVVSTLQALSHFWEFQTIADFNSFCNNPTGPSLPCYPIAVGAVGVTLGTNSIIFLQNEPFPYAAAAGGHEEGHQLDNHFQALLGIPASKSAQYLAKVNKDWTNFNAKTPCTLNGTGAFDSRRDHNSVYICTGLTGTGGALTGAYSAGTNESVAATTLFKRVIARA
jgi:hypothetical protein